MCKSHEMKKAPESPGDRMKSYRPRLAATGANALLISQLSMKGGRF